MVFSTRKPGGQDHPVDEPARHHDPEPRKQPGVGSDRLTFASSDEEEQADGQSTREDTYRDARLDSKGRKQDESRSQGAGHRTQGVRKIKSTGSGAHASFRLLHDGVGQRKRSTHEERGHERHDEDGLELDPKRPRYPRAPRTGFRPRPTIDGPRRRAHKAPSVPANPAIVVVTRENLGHSVSLDGATEATMPGAARDGAQPQADEDNEEEHREHEAIPPQHGHQMPEPDDLQTHPHEPGEEDRHGHEEGSLAKARFHRCFRRRSGKRNAGGFRKPTGRPEQPEGAQSRHQIEGDRNGLGRKQAERGHEREIGQETPQRRARGIEAVQKPDLEARLGDVPRHDIADEERERSPHEGRDRGEQEHRGAVPKDQGGTRQVVPSPIVLHVGRKRPRKSVELTQGEGQDQPETGNPQLEERIAFEPEGGVVAGTTIAPCPGQISTEPEPSHEHRGDDRCGVHCIAEDIAELADPDDLVDQTARAGNEENQVEHPGAG